MASPSRLLDTNARTCTPVDAAADRRDCWPTRRIDLKRRRIEVVEAITEVHGRVVVGTTKTHQRRTVPIPRFLADELAVELATKAPGDLVFTAPEGGVLAEHQFPTTVLRPCRRESRPAWTDAA
ncbi:MAG TPA: hypothetical protein VI094_11110 [Propionibacteriaceae bacterium]